MSDGSVLEPESSTTFEPTGIYVPPEPTPPGGASGDGSSLHQLHVFERLRLFDEEELATPTAVYIVPLSDFLAVSSTFGVYRALAQHLASGAMSYPSVVRDGFLQRLRHMFDEYVTIADPAPLALLDPILVGELHCPNVPAATAELEASSSSAKTIALEITAAGVGGGGWTRSRVFSQQAIIPAAAGYCAGLFVRVSGTFSIWQHPDTHHIAILVNVTGIGALFRKDLEGASGYDPSSHLCLDPRTYSDFLKEVQRGHLAINKDYDWVSPQTADPGAPAETHTNSWDYSRKYTSKGSFGASLKGVALGTVGVTLTSRFVDKVDVSIKFPPNHDYIGRYESVRSLPQQWGAS